MFSIEKFIVFIFTSMHAYQYQNCKNCIWAENFNRSQ